MAFRLADLIIAGELFHTRPSSVHGRLALRGAEMPICFELTGNPSPDLYGRNFEFQVPANDRPATEEDRALAAELVNQQIGPTGEITAARRVKTFTCSPEEVLRLSELGKKPPTTLRQCLYLEWFSQNGRVVIELVDPELTFLNRDGEPMDEQEFQTYSALLEGDSDEAVESTAGSTNVSAREESLQDDDDGFDEGYDLNPGDLERDLEQSARRLERELSGAIEPLDDSMKEFEQMEQLLESDEWTRIGDLLKDLPDTPSPAELSEAQAAAALKIALTHLALFGIAFHVCEHCSMREAYRIFVSKICEEKTVMREARKSSFVQHFSTSDFCNACAM